MRLLQTETLQFQEFLDSNIPNYAVLSHRWAVRELTYQEFRDSPNKSGRAFSKVVQCCVLARQRGLRWVWIDNVCIDRTSSAELSESINSMFRWYAGAVECYAYLWDVIWLQDSKQDLE